MRERDVDVQIYKINAQIVTCMLASNHVKCNGPLLRHRQVQKRLSIKRPTKAARQLFSGPTFTD